MNKEFRRMSSFINVYFGMDYDIFGNTLDEVVKCYALEVKKEYFDMLIEEFKKYLFLYSNDTDDVFFDKTFDHCYLYTGDYDNSVEFLKDVLNKLIFYRDQRLREEAEAAKRDA